MPPDELVWDHFDLRRRVGVNLYSLLQDIIMAAHSKRRYVRIDYRKEADSLKVTLRHVRAQVRELMEHGLLKRGEGEFRRSYMPMYENFGTVNLGGPVKHPNYKRRGPGQADEIHAKEITDERQAGPQDAAEMADSAARGSGEFDGGSLDECVVGAQVPDQGHGYVREYCEPEVHVGVGSRVLGFTRGTPDDHRSPDAAAADSGGNVLPGDGAGGDGERGLECPACHGTGRIEASDGDPGGPKEEAGFPFGSHEPGGSDIVTAPKKEAGFPFIPPEKEAGFPPRETYCPWNWTCVYLMKDLASAKSIVDLKSLKQAEQSQSLLASEITELNDWISKQAWGRIDSMRRVGLSDAEARPVVELLHSVRYRVHQFLGFLRLEHITISPERREITGLLISLVKRMPAFASYPARNRSIDRSGGPPG